MATHRWRPSGKQVEQWISRFDLEPADIPD
jgi:hypothetical protein